MPSIFTVDYPVPLIRQQPGSMGCWYASAQMVLHHRGVANMVVQTSTNIQTLARFFVDKGLNPTDVKTFSTEVGLSHRMASDTVKQQSLNGWVNALKTYGPLWVAISKTNAGATYGHVVAVRGARQDGTLWINDPEDLSSAGRPVGAFSAQVYWGLPFLFKLSSGAVF